MTKHRLILTGILAASLIVASGCSSAKAATTSTTETTKPTTQTTTSSSGQNSGQAGQKAPMERPGLVGKVKTIVGNSVTLEVAEMPKMEEGKQPSGEKPTGTPPAGNSGEGQSGKGNRQGGGMPEMKYTGDVKEIDIPVGVTIEQRGRGETKTLQISDITAGSILMVYYGDDGSTISKINVRQGSTQ